MLDRFLEGYLSGMQIHDRVGRQSPTGKTNMEAPQGSPLSPVVFLIFMASILEAMENRIRAATGLETELPSYVDDILASIMDPRATKNMDQVLDRANIVVNEAAMEWGLPLELDKMERLVFRRKKGGRGRRRSG